ncbi:MAG: plasmid mobilization relaxosome protein MobC [Flavobacteriales bacterium]|nr:plasmid mobilization relaxosome protein MobC [Flavobacteriales bacterium]
MVRPSKDFANGYNSGAKDMNTSAEYRKEYRNRHRRIEIVCAVDEFDSLKSSAKKHGKKLSPFLLECAFTYLKKGFILPDETELSELKTELRRWGNNLNQLAYQANKERSANTQLIYDSIALVKKLEHRLEQFFHRPISLEKAIEEEAHKDPQLIPRLQYLLTQLQ